MKIDSANFAEILAEIGCHKISGPNCKTVVSGRPVTCQIITNYLGIPFLLFDNCIFYRLQPRSTTIGQKPRWPHIVSTFFEKIWLCGTLLGTKDVLHHNEYVLPLFMMADIANYGGCNLFLKHKTSSYYSHRHWRLKYMAEICTLYWCPITLTTSI